jgi:hypothetical protein
MQINRYLCLNRNLRERLHALGIELTDSLTPALSQAYNADNLATECIETARRLEDHQTMSTQPGSPSTIFQEYLGEPTPDKPFGDEHWDLPKWSAELEDPDAERAIENLITHFEASELDLLARVCAQKACDFGMPTSAKGGYMYVDGIECPNCSEHVRPDADICDGCGTELSDNERVYERVPCQHPMESVTVRDVLGSEASTEFIDAHTGFNSYCLCLSCNAQFERDLDCDGRRCPICDGTEVYTEHEMVGRPCPCCSIGIVIEQFTGCVT